MAAAQDFLNAKSMLTPGVAGGLTTLITNTLATQFGAPPNYTGLAISFLCGLIVFASTVAGTAWLKLVLYVLNSLLIFSVALGANQAGVQAAKIKPAATKAASAAQVVFTAGPNQEAFFSNWLDDTVPKRRESIAVAEHLEPHQAAKALDTLGLPPAAGSAKEELTRHAAMATNASAVDAINEAMMAARGGYAASPRRPAGG